MTTDPRPIDGALLREALDGLFEIAREDNPPQVIEALRDQVEGLPPEACRELLEEMVDKDTLRTYLDKIRRGESFDAQIPAFGPDEMRKVDAVLDPLARIEHGSQGVQSLHRLSAEKRAHILFDTIGRRR